MSITLNIICLIDREIVEKRQIGATKSMNGVVGMKSTFPYKSMLYEPNNSTGFYNTKFICERAASSFFMQIWQLAISDYPI